ncbi:maleylpyruvate isomerase N-terminal domain-containing protein [Streptomyces marispadix]|uniref:Maleylpyruvate isomerase N-terminal domain-containing protein n=1 Tax=Streptomyces marispadix TaxID=2922868 RepID=A0ABS9STT9_9ACTN|nr:maleylpyruvate isomerase N-terminal domain-containing protein [Streptomyces marispadix]MCH6159682.1 maleylpyruvate isomerase N-terminal domain-containing protein [Streptomyces marispadix]
MPDHAGPARISEVTAEDVHEAVRLAVTALREGIEADWSVKAGSLEWDCWDTVEHLADDLFAYAAQLTPDNPPSADDIPFRYTQRREVSPYNAVFADRDSGPAGLLRVLEACGALLVAMVRTAPPGLRAWHPFGVADPEGFAAMGVVETLVHAHDVAQGVGVSWSPPEDMCERVLKRLFPDVEPDDAAPWQVLLWATGRTGLPGRPRRTSWRWYGAPPGQPEDTETPAAVPSAAEPPGTTHVPPP